MKIRRMRKIPHAAISRVFEVNNWDPLEMRLRATYLRYGRRPVWEKCLTTVNINLSQNSSLSTSLDSNGTMNDAVRKAKAFVKRRLGVEPKFV